MATSKGAAAPNTVLWIIGRPASGKTTLGESLAARLGEEGVRTALIDSDDVRTVVTPEPRYTREERAQLYRSLAYSASLLAQHGVIPIVAATAHERVFRDWARQICPGLFLIYADCPLDVCVARDPRGLYAAAKNDPNSRLPGIGVPFETPDDADAYVDTSKPVPAERLAEVLRAAGCVA